MDSGTDSRQLQEAAPARRRWRLPALVVLLAALAGGWWFFWFQASERAQETMAAWLAREAKSERFYGCGGRQEIGGFPFRFELRCKDPQAEFRALQSPLSLRAADLLVALQIYQPDLLIAEIEGPMLAGPSGGPLHYVADWSQARASLRGTPRAPERLSLEFDEPVIERREDGAIASVFAAERAELHGRLAAGSVHDAPVIDVALSLVAATVPELHPLAARAFDLDLDLQLVGLRNFDPKPWQARFREIQKNGGRIEIRNLRLQLDEALATASGTLKLTEAGYLDGELQLTAAGLDKVLPALGADQLVRPGSSTGKKLDAALESLDRVMPGLGDFARQKAGLGVAAGAAFLGEPTELEGRKAVKLPLQFVEGEMRLGPLKLGRIAPLF